MPVCVTKAHLKKLCYTFVWTFAIRHTFHGRLFMKTLQSSAVDILCYVCLNFHQKKFPSRFSCEDGQLLHTHMGRHTSTVSSWCIEIISICQHMLSNQNVRSLAIRERGCHFLENEHEYMTSHTRILHPSPNIIKFIN